MRCDSWRRITACLTMSENFMCTPRVPLRQHHREINAVLNGHLLLGNRATPSQGGEDRFSQDAVWPQSFFHLTKALRLERRSFCPFTFEQLELFSYRDHKIDFMPLVVTIKIDHWPTALISIGPHHLSQG